MSIAAPRDIYVRHTGKEGNSYVNQHRVWDADRFIAAQQAEAAKAGGKAKAEQITEEQYRAARK
ncbi:hypothetical protein KDK82_1765 [Delftia sp. K82]|jgi:hypothetical protein|uniref:hypothetical protein n=1 Tax=Delftia TaxID=80865 RepID=UPI000B4907E6|nr:MULTISPECIES: hypothetical protein [Delftia]OWG18286.1 hypothetical protein KDK82_1765 [Delftia sp. K82]